MSGQKIIDGLQQAINGEYTTYKKYVGICIDGPMIGQSLVIDCNFYRVPLYQEPVLFQESALFDANLPLSYNVFEYKHSTIKFYNYNEMVGVWFDASKFGRNSDEYVLKTLLDYFIKHSTGA